jgi:CubicO group peptidase (beta-lactamase class C family)/D-alanyl-D-alanine dipeptidase/beta-lactamase class A
MPGPAAVIREVGCRAGAAAARQRVGSTRAVRRPCVMPAAGVRSRALRAASGCAVAVALALLAPTAALHAQQSVAPAAGYVDVARALERLIEHELHDKDLPAISIALVDDQRVVWARGFGRARDGVPATAETVHRVGSVSKLFTDIGIMQLVERGQVDLDAPVTRYLPSFRPDNPHGREITLRQLMAHRSGLQREPGVGNYFDDTEPSLQATVASLNGRPLVYAPETKTKYSNAGIAVVGHALEAIAGEPFAAHLQRSVLAPLGLENASFEPTPHTRAHLADAFMWTRDGRRFPAPTFQLGMAPAGSMYASVLDLGRFMSVLFAGGQGAHGRVLRPETIEQMFTPQYAAPGQRTGFGIGFAIDELDGRRRVGHDGAIYGFATDMAALPDDRLGVAVVITLDMTNAVAARITDAALRLMLAAKHEQPLPEIRIPAPLTAERAQALAGRYENANRAIELVERYGELSARMPGTYALRAFGDTLVIDDRAAFGTRLLPLADGRIVLGRDTLRRAAASKPARPAAAFAGLIGEFGRDHNTLFIYEDGGRLHALIEWFFAYPLERVSGDTYAFPARGLYDGETLVFTRDAATGRAMRVEAAGISFERRAVGTEAGETFRITPLRTIDELRRDALAATPPVEQGDFVETDLVELRSLDPSIRYDIRYVTTNNFMSAVFYSEAKAFLQRPAAEALVRAHRRLQQHGYGLLIHDAYRPWYVTKMFFDATPEHFKHFVADPARGSRHNRGAAVDLTLYDLATGEVIEMVGGYDEFSERSYPDYAGGTALQRWHRELLRDAMEAEGFRVYEFEWWHFDFDGWERFRIGNQVFEQIGALPRTEPQSGNAAADGGAALADELEARVRARLDALDARAALHAKHLPSGREIAIRGDEPMNTLSVIKIPVMVLAYRDAEAGRLDLNERYTIRPEDLRRGSGLLQHFAVGLAPTWRDLITQMIVTSDNTATDLVIGRVGLERVNRMLDSLGFGETRMRATTGELFRRVWVAADPAHAAMSDREVYERGFPRDAQAAARSFVFEGDSTEWLGRSTARGTSRLLEALYEGRLAGERSTREMISILQRQLYSSRLPQRLAGVAAVAHKTGDWPPIAGNDVGILLYEGGPTVISVYTNQNRGSFLELEAAIGLIAEDIVRSWR